ncbi:MAG TPA: DUF4294 domain-containing protein [Chitinophagales bacterium]|jgi:hypothetical protein|nr:DUF4294 domain-containing protein [Chitinophagales bacterium]HQW78533.1 DUF4294 domain-containing protein [Chitinophagales bacterium]HRB67801.1 DUF4294 domain-containing protein [Chitinophagales bacterium]
MKKSFCIIILLLSMIPFSGAQSENDNIVLPQTVIDGDTLPEIIFEPILVTDSKLEKVNLEEWQMRYIRKVYPYALRTARLNKKIQEDLIKCDTKKERKRYLNECEKVLRAEFETTLKNLTRKQGQYLILLIHRETGITVYDLLKDYRSKWKAFWWNFAGKFYDLEMKAEYEPQGKDKETENYIQRLQYIYHTDGTNYLIQHEQFHTPIPGQKRSK